MAGELRVDSLKASSGVLATQNGMTGIAKAWVKFSPPTGTVVVNAQFNVSSVTRVSAGVYTVNFTTSMPDANFCTNVNSWNRTTNTGIGYNVYSQTISSVGFATFESDTATDPNAVFVAVHGN